MYMGMQWGVLWKTWAGLYLARGEVVLTYLKNKFTTRVRCDHENSSALLCTCSTFIASEFCIIAKFSLFLSTHLCCGCNACEKLGSSHWTTPRRMRRKIETYYYRYLHSTASYVLA